MYDLRITLLAIATGIIVIFILYILHNAVQRAGGCSARVFVQSFRGPARRIPFVRMADVHVEEPVEDGPTTIATTSLMDPPRTE
jgi:hypothetical protein